MRFFHSTNARPYFLKFFGGPFFGLYFSFGINYRHLQSTLIGAVTQLELDVVFQKEISYQAEDLLKLHQKQVGKNSPIEHPKPDMVTTH